MKQVQLVLLFAMVVATTILVEAAEGDDQKCRDYAKQVKVSDLILSRCGPFELDKYDPKYMGCKDVCSKINKNFSFPYEGDKGCCCATFTP